MAPESIGWASVIPKKVEGAGHGEGEEKPFFPRRLGHGAGGRGEAGSESGESGSGMGLTRTTAGTGETTHFLSQLGGHGGGHEALVWELRLGTSDHCHMPFPLFQHHDLGFLVGRQEHLPWDRMVNLPKSLSLRESSPRVTRLRTASMGSLQ